VAGRKEGRKENGGDVLAASDFEMKTATKVNKILRTEAIIHTTTVHIA